MALGFAPWNALSIINFPEEAPVLISLYLLK